MASYTISTAVTTAGNAQTINTGDTVTVTSSGSLNGTGTTGVGIFSDNAGGASGGFDTLNISGTVRGSEYGFEDTGLSGHDSVTVNSGGSIFGGYNAGPGAGIYIDGGVNTISNDGQVVDNLGGYGIELRGAGNTIDNTGTISTTGNSAIYITDGSNTITNSGTISAPSATGIDIGGGGGNSITNSGTVGGKDGIYLSGDSNSITNSGTVSASFTSSNYGIEVSGDHNSIDNTGTIKAVSTGQYASGVDLDGDSNTFTNSGTISGTAATYGTGAYGTGVNNVFVNKAAGVITGSYYGVWNDGSSTVLKDSGVISGGSTGAYLEGSNNVVKVLHGGSIAGTSSYGIYSSYGGNLVVDKGTISSDSATGIYLSDGHNTLKVGAHGMVNGGDGYGFFDDSGASDHIFNAGTITGHSEAIYLGSDGGSSHIHNTGSILAPSDSAIYIYDGGNHVTNQGTISGVGFGLDIYGYTHTGHNIVNNLTGGLIKAAATATSDAALYFDYGNNTVNNSGTISIGLNGNTGDAAIWGDSTGSNVIVNNAGGLITDFHGGQTSNYAIYLNDDGNSVTNDGKIVGTVQIGTSGTNTYDGSGGHLKGTVVGGAGVDTIILGAGHSGAEGGGGADAITIGSGADNVVYTGAGDSNVSAFDAVDGFTAGADHFTFVTAGAFSGLDSVTVSSLSAVTDTALQAATAGHLDANGAVVLSVSSGLYAGDVFLLVDADGNAGFDNAGVNTDYLVVLTHLSGTLTAADITTTT